MVHRREVDGEVLVLGNQGALWGNAMTWWDHDTGTVWSQPIGEAIVGPRRGARMELMASQLTSWETWVDAYPETMALDAPGGNSRFDLARMSIVVDFGTEVGVYDVADLREDGPANDVVAGVPVSIVTDPSVDDRWNVFHREVAGQVLTLETRGDDLVDAETGTVWDPSSGRALRGALDGEILDQLPGFTSFPSDARTFWPDANYWSPGS